MRPRYEREIEEILERLDTSPSATPTRVVTPPRPIRVGRPAAKRSPSRITPSTLFIVGLALAALSAPIQWAYEPAVPFIGVACAALLVGGIMTSVMRAGAGRSPPRWRGQPMPNGPNPIPLFGSGIAGRWRRWRASRDFRGPRWN